jgi:hypothetical protein
MRRVVFEEPERALRIALDFEGKVREQSPELPRSAGIH